MGLDGAKGQFERFPLVFFIFCFSVSEVLSCFQTSSLVSKVFTSCTCVQILVQKSFGELKCLNKRWKLQCLKFTEEESKNLILLTNNIIVVNYIITQINNFPFE